MKLSKHWVAATLFCLACGDDDGAAEPKGDGGANTRADSSVTNPDRDAAAGGDRDASSCNAGEDTTPGTCTEAQYATYGKCLQTACDSHFEVCNGPDYKKGKYAGLCGDWLACVSKCGCDATPACVTACGSPSAQCSSCLEDVSCADSCGAEPACATEIGSGGNDGGSGDAGSGANCETLKACCETLTDSDKTDCLGVLGQAQMIPSAADQFCRVSVMSYQSVGDCK